MRFDDGENENAADFFWVAMMPTTRVAANVRPAMIVYLAVSGFPTAVYCTAPSLNISLCLWPSLFVCELDEVGRTEKNESEKLESSTWPLIRTTKNNKEQMIKTVCFSFLLRLFS